MNQSAESAPYQSLAEDEATGIVKVMPVSTNNALGILEEARFVVDLLSLHGMSLAEVAQASSWTLRAIVSRRNVLHSKTA